MNMKTKTIAYDFPQVGCYIDESAGSADDCNRRTIEFAQAYGFKPGRGVWQMGSEGLSWVGDKAVEFLNDLETRTALYWTFEDNSLFLVADPESAKEQVGFVSSRDQEYPADDYTGEWLHVNERGNCTLYMRQSGEDKEIWGIV